MIENITLKVISVEGLHLRSSAHLYNTIVDTRKRFGLDVGLYDRDVRYDGIISILSLGKDHDELVNVRFNGERCKEALDYFLSKVGNYFEMVSDNGM